MLTVKNKRTGVTGIYPKRQAEWLVSTGRCELVAPGKTGKPEPSKPRQKAPRKESEKKQDAAVSQEKAPEVSVALDAGGETPTQDSGQPQTEADDGPEQ